MTGTSQDALRQALAALEAARTAVQEALGVKDDTPAQVPDLVPIKQIAKEIGRSPETIRRWGHQHNLLHRIGKNGHLCVSRAQFFATVIKGGAE